MRVKSHPGYPVLLHMVESFVTEFHPRQLANVFWAVRSCSRLALLPTDHDCNAS